ncbi:MAG: biotin/lipoyl-binding protein, partial [Betaproteobacteria bacterium]
MTRAQTESGHALGSVAADQDEEAALWAAFSLATSGEAAAEPWTFLQAHRLPGARACAVFRELGPTLELVAAWPVTQTLPRDLPESAREGLGQGVALVRSALRGFHLVCPVPGSEGWVAAAEVAPLSAAELQSALDTLHWGVGWLAAARAAAAEHKAVARNERLELAARLAENVARERDAASASMALAAGVGATFGASEVTVGVLRRGRMTVAARWYADEQSAGGDAGADAPERAAAVDRLPVLQSVLDVGHALRVERHDIQGDQPPEQSPAAIELLAVAAHVCAMPLPGPETAAGAIVVERVQGAGFDDEEVASLETIALQAAPLIEAKPLARPTPVTRERRAFVALFGPVRMKSKLLLVALLAGALVMLGATGRFGVPVDGVIEGAQPKVLAAPFGGTLGQVFVHRGDVVTRGQMLARMDDKELLQARTRLEAERSQLATVTREAREIRDRPPTEALDAKLKEVEARLRTTEEQLARARVLSPTDGVVVGGAGLDAADSRVAAGQSLVEIAPVDSYRLVLWVDERDLTLMREGQA